MRLPTLLATILVPATLLLAACGGSSDDQASCPSSSDFAEFQCVNRSDFVAADGTVTPLSQHIADCTILASYNLPCTLDQLGFIASDSTTPTKAQILERLIVSDPWMAENFASLLDLMPADMYNLFASVTAIVIHSEIRPGFFWPFTGAIYIDPDYLWLTQEQLATISQKADYRSSYDDSLLFMSIARYTKNGEYAFSTNGERTQEQALYALSALLFHELAHARDFFPTASILAASGSATPYSIIPATTTSDALNLAYPLTNTTLYNLARVIYQGEAATPYQQSLTAGTVGSLFEADGANDSYNYSSIHEDTAMLFEETMMKIHYGIDREIAFVTPLVDNPQYCEDLVFDWTAINRYANANVDHRAELVMDALLPGNSHTLPAADGTFSWCNITTVMAARSVATLTGSTVTEKLPFDFWH